MPLHVVAGSLESERERRASGLWGMNGILRTLHLRRSEKTDSQVHINHIMSFGGGAQQWDCSSLVGLDNPRSVDKQEREVHLSQCTIRHATRTLRAVKDRFIVGDEV